MARYRDVKTVSVFGTSFTGVQDIDVGLEAENFLYSADEHIDLRRVDVTKQKITISMTIQDPAFKRDIKDPVFGTSPQVALNEVLSIAMSESCDVIADSSEDDQWITYIGTTRRQVAADFELRDINQIMTAATIKIGDKDTLQFDVLPGSSTTGLADGSAYERFNIYNAVVTGISPSLKHGDLASGTVNFIGYGDDANTSQIYNTLSAGGSTGFEKHTGDSGTISFIAPSVLGSGSDVTVTIANCVCTGVEVNAQHAGRMERRFTFEAYSSDGSTSPLTLS